jgi:hypothetical protein
MNIYAVSYFFLVLNTPFPFLLSMHTVSCVLSVVEMEACIYVPVHAHTHVHYGRLFLFGLLACIDGVWLCIYIHIFNRGLNRSLYRRVS